MVDPRTRDRVWIETITEALEGRSVTPSYLVNECDVSERTAREVLKVMADVGLVQEDRVPDGRVRFVPAGPFS